MTKGILVILMVVYHSLNYTNQYHLSFRFLTFLPLSFILITGFFLSSIYSVRYAAGDRRLIRRLLFRGLRLFALFTALNIVGQFVRSPAYGKSVGIANFFQKWDEIYLIGGSRIAAFEVLLPIAYLLLVAPCLIAITHRHAGFLPIASALFAAGCGLLDQRGIALDNLNFLCAGIFGMLAGRLLPNPSILGRFVWLTVMVYAVYFPFGFANRYTFLVQLVGACIALALICAFSVRLGESGWWHQRIIRIGQYSLLSYIVQIGILQIISRVVGRPDPLSFEALVLFVGTLVIMTLVIECTEWVRSQSSKADEFYRAMFA